MAGRPKIYADQNERKAASRARIRAREEEAERQRRAAWERQRAEEMRQREAMDMLPRICSSAYERATGRRSFTWVEVADWAMQEFYNCEMQRRGNNGASAV